ncbi:MAG: glycosyltransferase family 2 protein [Holophaga sp.]|nr:glycosyltransferase family 2 protein [Holophaga sp.]
MTKDKDPLFSVVIPAKNRADYLWHTLRTCMIQEYDRLEVIVSDDGSTDHTREVVEKAARMDPRIRYVSPGNGVGMRDNFEFALNQIKPGFALALGADDGLLPYGISGMASHLHESGAELLAWTAPIFSYAGARCKDSQIILYKGGRDKIIQSDHFLRRQSEHLHYLSDNESPMFYVKGVTSTRLIDSVRKRSPEGRFYACPTPDGYSGLVLAGEVFSYAYSRKPYALFGVSPASQGMAYLGNNKEDKERSEDFYRTVTQKNMHPQLASQPYSPLITLMTADYILTIQDLPGWPGRFGPLDFKKVLEKGLLELAHGLYGGDRLARELAILNAIANHHGLGPFFRDLVKISKRFSAKATFEGSGIGPKVVMLDGKTHNIKNVFDAAYFAFYSFQISANLTIRSVAKMLDASLRYRIRSSQKGENFPPESEWLQPLS